MAARCLVGTYQIKFGVQILAPTFLCGLCLLSLCLCVFSPGTLAFFHIQICPAIAWEGASPACTLALTPSQLGWVFFIMDYFLLIICANYFYSSSVSCICIYTTQKKEYWASEMKLKYTITFTEELHLTFSKLECKCPNIECFSAFSMTMLPRSCTAKFPTGVWTMHRPVNLQGRPL